MKRWKMGIRTLAALVGLGLLGSGLHAESPEKDSISLAAAGSQPRLPPTDEDSFVVHEWGTFTSFSGSNGVQLDFRPLINSDLPAFVFDRHMQSGAPILTKLHVRARVRMETPVTYFYTNKERTIKASVEFPNGLLTEFYPPVETMTPDFSWNDATHPPFKNSKLDWGEINLIPVRSLTPAVKDCETADWLRGLIAERVLPSDGAPSNHYYRARETDSALVHVKRPQASLERFRPSGNFIEKFLFYRGVGSFNQPLHVVVDEKNRIQITNQGDRPLRSIFRVTVADKLASISAIQQLKAHETLEFPEVAQAVTIEELKDQVSHSLVEEGLYTREARAMVETWADSWFSEEGTRIFYMVPQEVTDQILPLNISPQPDTCVRVLVGRIEIMTPSMESQLMEVVRLNALQRSELAKRQAQSPSPERTQLKIPTPLKKLGRLAEPALVRIAEIAKSEETSHEAMFLLRQLQASFDQPQNEYQNVASPD